MTKRLVVTEFLEVIVTEEKSSESLTTGTPLLHVFVSWGYMPDLKVTVF